ncbi:hypothetical protein Sliba_11330 [Streptomyces nigrescens]|uniref:Uncharacterized protein n=1 Tax=Streptomyces nigrescens TaxID=1920 RepID=A0A640TBU8_STRNI|nr:hypothetical protein Sliba_11330 [Streptomyces libani subsp. libani]GGV87778.1 hypothetical protein GCM10010500_08740 [Streptomyces libani subsp. libani]
MGVVEVVVGGGEGEGEGGGPRSTDLTSPHPTRAHPGPVASPPQSPPSQSAFPTSTPTPTPIPIPIPAGSLRPRVLFALLASVRSATPPHPRLPPRLILLVSFVSRPFSLLHPNPPPVSLASFAPGLVRALAAPTPSGN